MTPTKVIGSAISIPKKLPQNVSYSPWITAGIAIAKKYNDILYFGYKFANEIKYPRMN